MNDMSSTAQGTSRPVRFLIWWQAFMAFANYVAAAGVLSDLASPKIAAGLLVLTGGLNQATGVYVSKALSGGTNNTPPGVP